MNLKNISTNKVLIHLVKFVFFLQKTKSYIYFYLALNIQNEIIHLIATGIILIEFFFQIPISERKTFLIPFDHERIQVRQ